MKTIQINQDYFHGAISLEPTQGGIKPWRIPYQEKALFASGLVERAEQSAGVRIRLETNSPRISINQVPVEFPDATKRYDLSITGRLMSSQEVSPRQEDVLFDDLGEERKIVDIWLPQFSASIIRSIAVEDGCFAEPAADNSPKWVTYGSSITHCRAAHSPARTWPATAARESKLNLTSLGYGGNCHLDPLAGMMIRDSRADLITMKLGINTWGSLSSRTFPNLAIGLVRIIREKHPDCPIGIISPIICPGRELTPHHPDGQTLVAMREQLQDAVTRLQDMGDKQLWYFDGRQLFSEEDTSSHLPDGVHPDGDGYEMIGKNVSGKVLPTLLRNLR